jgi:hypothetical protein
MSDAGASYRARTHGEPGLGALKEFPWTEFTYDHG